MALAIWMARSVTRSTSERERSWLEAKPQEPSTSTRTPKPMDSSILMVSTTPFRTEKRSWLVSTTRISAYPAPLILARSRARDTSSSMNSTPLFTLHIESGSLATQGRPHTRSLCKVKNNDQNAQGKRLGFYLNDTLCPWQKYNFEPILPQGLRLATKTPR